MGTGWRRAFCTSVRRVDPTDTTPTPRASYRIPFFGSSASAPSTPRPQAPPAPSPSVPTSPALRCRTGRPPLPDEATTDGNIPKPSPREPPLPYSASNPCSPRSPSRFALLRSTLRLSRRSCGICLKSVKSVQGTAIFIAECSHAFHFPCISSHARNHRSLSCPVCHVQWQQAPHLGPPPTALDGKDDDSAAAAESDGGRVCRAAIKQGKTARDIAAAAVVEGKKKGGNFKKDPTDPPAETAVIAAATKVYCDDEPLLSPGGSAARFNPIPEADDEDENGKSSDGDFQGFHAANPSLTPPSTFSGDPHLAPSCAVDIAISPDAALLLTGRTHESYVVALKIKALPPPPSSAPRNAREPLIHPSRRAPVDLVAVLDVGGTMTVAKFHMLRHSLRLLVSSLGSADRLSLVTYGSDAKRLLPLRRMTAHGQRAARRIADRLVYTQGGGGAEEALRKASRILEDRRERNPAATIMLLSDGQQQSHRKGEQQPPPSRYQASLSCRSYSTTSSSTEMRFSHLEIPVGDGPWPEDAFAKCVGGLLSLVVQDARLQLSFPAGEIAGVYSMKGQPAAVASGGRSVVRLGDLYADEERELLVELRVSAGLVDHNPQPLLTGRCTYRDPGTHELVLSGEQPLPVPLPPASHRHRRQHSSPSASSLPKAERLRNLFVTTRALAEARRLCDRNEHHTAARLLASAKAVLQQSSSISADENLREVETELVEVQRRRKQRRRGGEREAAAAEEGAGGVEVLTPTSAWRAAERLAKVAMMRKSLNRRVSDLHGFEDARF